MKTILLRILSIYLLVLSIFPNAVSQQKSITVEEERWEAPVWFTVGSAGFYAREQGGWHVDAVHFRIKYFSIGAFSVYDFNGMRLGYWAPIGLYYPLHTGAWYTLGLDSRANLIKAKDEQGPPFYEISLRMDFKYAATIQLAYRFPKKVDYYSWSNDLGGIFFTLSAGISWLPEMKKTTRSIAKAAPPPILNIRTHKQYEEVRFHSQEIEIPLIIENNGKGIAEEVDLQIFVDSDLSSKIRVRKNVGDIPLLHTVREIMRRPIKIGDLPPLSQEQINIPIKIVEEITKREEIPITFVLTEKDGFRAEHNFNILLYPSVLKEIVDRFKEQRPDLFAPRGQFETSQEYSARQKRAEEYLNEQISLYHDRIENERVQKIIDSRREVTIPVSLGRYDPDTQVYRITINGKTEPLKMPVDAARRLYDNRDRIDAIGIEQLTDDLASTELINIHIIDPVTGQGYPFGVQKEIVDLPYIPPELITHPPQLVLSDPVFTDTDGDNRLSAGERAIIQFNITNKGEGTARGVNIRGETDSPISGLSANVGNINPGESRSISITLTGGERIRDGEARITLNVNESMGFHADPIEIIIPTRAYRPPKIVVHDVGIDDPQGRGIITPGQVVDITVRLLNIGEGIAEDTRATLEVGRNIFLFGITERRKEVYIGTLEPGSYRDISFQAFSNREAEEFPVKISIRESTGQYGLPSTDLGLTLHTPQRTVRQLIVDSPVIDTTQPEVPRLSISIERDIPKAEQQNPDAIAVIIGNRTYRGDTPDVAFALRDASLTRRYVEQALGYRPGNILFREDATLTDMRVIFGDDRSPHGRLSDLVKEGQSDVFVYYSGHGAPDPNTKAGYLMPVDADPNRLSLTGYPLEWLYENLSQLGARSVTVVIDACFSGATGAGDMLIAQASPIGIEIRDPSIQIPNSVIITASTGSQIASWHPEKRHGLLTYFFLKGIQGAADFDNDGRITVGELRRYMSDRLNGLPYYARRLHGREQTPQVWGEEERVMR